MSYPDSWSARRTRLMNRIHARASCLARPAKGTARPAEPRSVGVYARGRQLLAGNLMFAGHLVEAPDAMLWEVAPPIPAYLDEIQGFGWLDDLAAVGDGRARALAQRWLLGWIAAYGAGRGPGWTPRLTGRRMMRWLQHGAFLTRGMTPEDMRRLHRAMGRQTVFLARRWRAAGEGLPRFEALSGLVHAARTLVGLERYAEPARRALGAECARAIGPEGGLPSRNPEELLEVFTLLTWTDALLREAGSGPDPEHRAAMERIAPTLRALRHADGGLARFHGGGRGIDGRLDAALAHTPVRHRAEGGLAMGYARLSGGRSSVVIDAAPPPAGAASFNAHASTLAFELTSGRRPLIVSCGAGGAFGEDWRRAGRATPSHSTLCLQGYSSARLGRAGLIAGARREQLEDGPRRVPIEMTTVEDGHRFEGAHDGYVATHGLTHARLLELTFDGRALVGEDMLMVLEEGDRPRFDRAIAAAAGEGLPWQLRFHLHPDVEAEVDPGGAAVSLALKSGELWVFRQEGQAELTLEPSVYLERGRLKPRATLQIVLRGAVQRPALRLRWSLSKAEETAIAVRDLAPTP